MARFYIRRKLERVVQFARKKINFKDSTPSKI